MATVRSRSPAATQAGAGAAERRPARNPGLPLELDWIRDIRVNRSSVERRAATLRMRRTVKKEWQAGWLLRAITLIDLTTLAGDDTPGTVRRLCAKARRPVRADLLDVLGAADVDPGPPRDASRVGWDPGPPRDASRVGWGVRVAAVCVYHAFVETAVDALRGAGVPVAAVSTGFPSGLTPFAQRLGEIRASVTAGAREIDVVITRAHVLTSDWPALYDEVGAFRDAAGDVPIKTILATGELGTLRNVARASLVCMMAGADFIKTSTGKEKVNATLAAGLVMARMIRAYHEATGHRVGLKPAGGIRSARQALDWMILVKEELGAAWLARPLFRLGASTLLSDIERQLEHHATGRYSAARRHPMI